MVTRKRFRTVLNALALYTIAALVIGAGGESPKRGGVGRTGEIRRSRRVEGIALKETIGRAALRDLMH